MRPWMLVGMLVLTLVGCGPSSTVLDIEGTGDSRSQIFQLQRNDVVRWEADGPFRATLRTPDDPSMFRWLEGDSGEETLLLPAWDWWIDIETEGSWSLTVIRSTNS